MMNEHQTPEQVEVQYGVFADRSAPEHGGVGVVLVDKVSDPDWAESIAAMVGKTWPTFVRARTVTTSAWQEVA